jgi:transcriptional regulator with XRE-family HTH domain
MKIIDRITGDDTELREMIAEETVNVRVARLIYEARTAADLTQQQLADLIGSKQPVIARLEDADYAGHSLSMLDRIAAALGHRLQIQFVPKGDRDRQSA